MSNNVGGFEFDSNAALLRFAQAILSRYKPGDRVSEDDEAFLRALFTRHPRYHEKAAGGIVGFVVRLREHGARCFHAILEDGGFEEFSIKQAAKG